MKEKKIKIWELEVNYKEFWENISSTVDSNFFKDILILHWWWWKSDSWIETSKELSKKWFRVIVPDLPWFWKTNIDKVYNLPDYAKIIEEFVKKLQLDSIILWWHSNWWAISIILENRWKINIERLVLNNSAWIRNDKKRSFKRKILNNISKIFKKIYSSSGEVSWVLIKLRELFYRSIWWHDYLESEKNPFLKKTYLNMISSDLKENIKNIKLNTLLIWWELDTYTPKSDWLFMRNNIKNSKLVILDNETHWIHLKNPKRLVETFLQNI